MGRFELYPDVRGDYRWRLRATNGQVIATGGQGYASERSAREGIESVKRNAPQAEVIEVER